MINSFQPLNTLTSGLIFQQLQQEVNANNLAQQSVDSQGYLMNSIEQLNGTNNASINFTGSNGLLSIGTGTSAASIVRLRSSYLDNQIQQESSVVGYNAVLYGAGGSGIMSQISSILNASSTTTLGSYLTAFATSWTNLAAAPTSAAALTAVVTAGANFAQAANGQYNGLKSLQSTITSQMDSTVIAINGYLKQLGNINQQLMNSASSGNNNSLLDARDYTLDKLSQLMNFQATFNSNGTANVWLKDISLVDGSGAATLNVNATNYTDTNLTNVTVVSSQGSTTIADASTEITGGALGGELAARDVIIPGYINDVNEFASTVITMTNNLTQAGYIPNSTTAGAAFFTGSNAATIAVSQSVSSTPALYIPTEVNQNAATGQLATILSNMPTLLAGNYLTSSTAVAAAAVNPTVSVNTQVAGVTGGSFTLNGTTVTYLATDSIQTILSKINSTVANVYAVFNDTTKKFEIFSSTPVTFVGTAGDKFKWANLKSVLISTMPINDSLANGQPLIDPGNESLSATYVAASPDGPNSLAFLVTPSGNGTFSVNGTQIQWYNSTDTGLAGIMSSLPANVSWLWLPGTQTIELTSSNSATSTAAPIHIDDVAGNLSESLWLADSSTAIQTLGSNMLSNLSNQTTIYQNAYTNASNSLTQLNTEQDDLAGANTNANSAMITQQAMTSMIQFNAMLQVMQIVDQMLDSLVGISSSTSSSGIFQKES